MISRPAARGAEQRMKVVSGTAVQVRRLPAPERGALPVGILHLGRPDQTPFLPVPALLKLSRAQETRPGFKPSRCPWAGVTSTSHGR